MDACLRMLQPEIHNLPQDQISREDGASNVINLDIAYVINQHDATQTPDQHFLISASLTTTPSYTHWYNNSIWIKKNNMDFSFNYIQSA